MNYKYLDNNPKIDEQTFIAPGTHIIGDVNIEKNVSIWHGTVLRGDEGSITIGEGTNIQDNSVIHSTENKSSTYIGKNVTVGHRAIIHGATIMDQCLIGMGAIVLDGAVIGKNTIIGAGSLVTGGKEIPEGVLCMGSPAKVIRNLTEKEIESIKSSAEHYIQLWNNHKQTK